jgi:hypothetical protein
MPLSHAQSIATKGLLNNNAVSLVSKGYIYIKIEEIPIPPDIGGAGSDYRIEDKLNWKIVKVTVIYKDEEYVQAKIINTDVDVSAKDVNVKLGEKVVIDINVDGIKIDNKDIETIN